MKRFYALPHWAQSLVVVGGVAIVTALLIVAFAYLIAIPSFRDVGNRPVVPVPTSGG